MQGKKDNEGKRFYTVTLSRLVPADHPVRRISEALELNSLYKETRHYYSHEGKPSVDLSRQYVLYKRFYHGRR